jgi:hypothetical protein
LLAASPSNGHRVNNRVGDFLVWYMSPASVGSRTQMAVDRLGRHVRMHLSGYREKPCVEALA